MSEHRTIIVGLDGVPFEMIRDLCRKGVMPNTDRLIENSLFNSIESTIPEISSVAWSSMITGCNPGQHGIFGFTDLFENSYRMRFPNFRDLKAEPFWDQWPGKAIIINVPSTFPVRKMRGIHISGFVSLDLARSVYPADELEKLIEMDYRLDVDSQKAHNSMELFLSDLDMTLDARIRAFRHLWNSTDWQTFMLVFTGTDRLMHFLWDGYEDETHRYHDHFLNHFNKIDGAIGEIVSSVSDDDIIVIHSDHGFERLELDVYINSVLKDNGFLSFTDTGKSLKNISDKAVAFALDPARIYLNLKGKYPNGRVKSEERDSILSALEKVFRSLEIEGRKVIRSIYRQEQIYHGPLAKAGPDMVLVSEKGFNLKANIKKDILYEQGIFTGKHTQDNAFMIMRGIEDRTIVPDKFSVADIKKVIETSNFTAKTCLHSK